MDTEIKAYVANIKLPTSLPLSEGEYKGVPTQSNDRRPHTSTGRQFLIIGTARRQPHPVRNNALKPACTKSTS